MLENLSDKLQDTFRNLTGRGKLTEKNIDDAMRQIRLALLEADVNYKIVKNFIQTVQVECLGEKVMKSVTPGQQAIKIVHDRLVELMGETNAPLNLSGKPVVIMIIGLHGSGKTTTTAKLALHLKKQGEKVLLAAADAFRPAAIDQLEILGKEVEVPVFSDRTTKDISHIASQAKVIAQRENRDVLIVDTAGRLQIEEELIQELISLKDVIKPQEVLLVADAALGQEAVSVAREFDQALGITGIILTKLDGDARGGAALSMRQVTGKPIKFIGTGEKITDLNPFYPDRMASRILGMGDVVTFVEKAAETISEEEAKKLEQKMLKKKYDLNDFLKQLQQLKKLGGMGAILEMMPGGRKLKEGMNIDESMMKHTEAIIQSMTKEERVHPEILGVKSRKNRITKGCGRPLVEVQQLIKRFETMRNVMANYKKFSSLLGGSMGNPFGGMGGMGGMDDSLGGGMEDMLASPGSLKPRSLQPQISQKQKKAKRKKKGKKRR